MIGSHWNKCDNETADSSTSLHSNSQGPDISKEHSNEQEFYGSAIGRA